MRANILQATFGAFRKKPKGVLLCIRSPVGPRGSTSTLDGVGPEFKLEASSAF